MFLYMIIFIKLMIGLLFFGNWKSTIPLICFDQSFRMVLVVYQKKENIKYGRTTIKNSDNKDLAVNRNLQIEHSDITIAIPSIK